MTLHSKTFPDIEVQQFPDCPDQLSNDQLATYREQGYLAYEKALTPEEVREARDGISELVRRYAFNDELCEMSADTSQKSNYSGTTFRSKSSSFSFMTEPGYEPDPARVNGLEFHLRKLAGYAREEPIFRALTGPHPKIKGIRDAILGPGSVIYQTMALIKPPHGGVEKPWHQDNAYFATENLDRVFGIWIALNDATAENGCMHILPCGHKMGPLRHHHTFDCEIEGERFDLSEAVPIEIKAGGILVFHSNLPHQTPINESSQRRRALQFHYRAADNPRIKPEAYKSIFVEKDGTPATCYAARPISSKAKN